MGGRYRLEKELGHGAASSVWRAHDENLEREVAVRLMDPSLDRHLLLERAALAASLTHPRVVRIFDTGFDAGQFFTVSELVPGSLGWMRLPLAPDEAVQLGLQVAEALAYGHERGVAHGAVHAGNVLLGEQGAKLGDFALSAPTLHGAPRRAADDLVGLGRLLYRTLTARDHGTPATDGKPLADEPRGIARVVTGLMQGTYASAGHAISDLEPLSPRPQAPVLPRRPTPILAAAGALVLAATVVGVLRLGSPGTNPEASPRVPATGTPVRIASVADFDPLGDGREGRATVARIADGRSETFWTTETYRGGPRFSDKKAGVGVIADLGRPQLVGGANVLFASAGCSFEIRHSNARARDVNDWPVLDSVRGAGTSSTVEFPATRSRWWLLWLTRLTRGVPGGSRTSYGCGVAEISFFPAGGR